MPYPWAPTRLPLGALLRRPCRPPRCKSMARECPRPRDPFPLLRNAAPLLAQEQEYRQGLRAGPPAGRSRVGGADPARCSHAAGCPAPLSGPTAEGPGQRGNARPSQRTAGAEGRSTGFSGGLRRDAGLQAARRCFSHLRVSLRQSANSGRETAMRPRVHGANRTNG
jgi:hypothetical protein